MARFLVREMKLANSLVLAALPGMGMLTLASNSKVTSTVLGATMPAWKRDQYDAEIQAGLGLYGLSNPQIRASIEASATNTVATAFSEKISAEIKEDKE